MKTNKPEMDGDTVGLLNLLDDAATIQDFIDLYGEEETLEITRLCQPLATTPDLVKLQAMIDNAKELVFARMLTANECGRALIKISAKQLILWIARYIGDSNKSRPFIEDDYKKAIAYLDYACDKCSERCPLSTADLELILGEDLPSTRSRLRAYSGYGNQLRYNLKPMPKVDYTIYDHLSLNRYWDLKQ